MIWFIDAFLTISLIHNQWLFKNHYIRYWTTSVFSSTVTDLVLIYVPLLLPLSTPQLEHSNIELSPMLRPTVSRAVSLGIKHPSGAYDQILITVRQLRVCWCVGRFLWREDGSVVCNCYWPSQAQSFSGPSPLGLATRFYCLRDSRLPISSPPTTRRVTVEVFDPASTRAGPYLSVTSSNIELSAESYVTTDGQPASLSWN
jgi:hypothetical protein